MKKITINKGPVEGKERLRLHFEFDKEVIALLKTIPGARWHPGEKCWHISVLAGPVDKLNRRFEGQFGGQYGASSIQHILKDAVASSKIRKKVTVHTLRHCFATHLLERGTDIRYIQELPGHQSSKTTEIYTHIKQRGLGKIKSPLDSFDI